MMFSTSNDLPLSQDCGVLGFIPNISSQDKVESRLGVQGVGGTVDEVGVGPVKGDDPVDNIAGLVWRNAGIKAGSAGALNTMPK